MTDLPVVWNGGTGGVTKLKAGERSPPSHKSPYVSRVSLLVFFPPEPPAKLLLLHPKLDSTDFAAQRVSWDKPPV